MRPSSAEVAYWRLLSGNRAPNDRGFVRDGRATTVAGFAAATTARGAARNWQHFTPLIRLKFPARPGTMAMHRSKVRRPRSGDPQE